MKKWVDFLSEALAANGLQATYVAFGGNALAPFYLNLTVSGFCCKKIKRNGSERVIVLRVIKKVVNMLSLEDGE